MERVLLKVSERALQDGARAGLEALVEATVRLTGTSGAALYAGERCVALRGLAPPVPAQAPALQCFQEGDTTLVLGEPPREAAWRPALQRLVELGGTLIAAQAREDAARTERTRERQERLRLMRLLAHRERVWSRASHDLRTPLLVLQGYLEMMLKGMSGTLTSPMQRYLERMVKSAADLNTRLQRFRADGTPPEDLRPWLLNALGAGKPCRVQLELPSETVLLRASRAELALLVRDLERMLSGTGASEVLLRVEAPEGTRAWRLHLQARTERSVPVRVRKSLERLARRWDAPLSLEEGAHLELCVLLPRPAA